MFAPLLPHCRPSGRGRAAVTSDPSISRARHREHLINIAGLPAHPLLVHLAVVFVPLAAAAFVLTMWRDTWRRGYASLVAAGAAAGATGAVLAAQSGEALEETLRRTAPTRPRFGEHPEQGDTAEILAVVFAIIAITVWALDRWGAPPRIQRRHQHHQRNRNQRSRHRDQIE